MAEVQGGYGCHDFGGFVMSTLEELNSEIKRRMVEWAHLKALIAKIQMALGTEEIDNALVQVARNAHNAILELAKMKRHNSK